MLRGWWLKLPKQIDADGIMAGEDRRECSDDDQQGDDREPDARSCVATQPVPDLTNHGVATTACPHARTSMQRAHRRGS